MNYGINLEKYPKVVDYIIEGKILDEKTLEERTFNYIDFLLLIGNEKESFKEFVKENFPKDVFTTVSRFLVNNKKFDMPICRRIENFYNIDYNYKNHNLTFDEKQMIVTFVEMYNFPKTIGMFYEIAKKYIEGILDIEGLINNKHVLIKTRKK